MRRALLIAAAVLMLGAAKSSTVDYRLGVGPGGLTVKMRIRGEADGETRLVLPAGLASDLVVSGGQVQAIDATHRVVRHRPGAKLTIRYRFAGGGSGVSALGQAVFVTPESWDAVPAAVRWQRLPAGWRAASDLDGLGATRILTVGDLRRSVLLAGAGLQTAERPIPGGALRVAAFSDDPIPLERLADAAAPAVAAERTYWNDQTGPFLLARAAVTDHTILDRAAGVVIPPFNSPDLGLRRLIIEGQVLGQTARRLGPPPAQPADWLPQGLASFLADRIMSRAGLATTDEAMVRIAQQEPASDPTSRGAMLALKWDDEVRRKTAGKADLDDVLLQMRDHAAKFPPGKAPDAVTGLVSAAWVVARIDIRPDIARYAATTAPIPLPAEMFDGCLQARVTVTPAFDAGFNTEASFAARQVRGVVRRGPAWNSGVRDGMALETWTYKAGDMTRMIELTVRPPRGKPRKITYWPYGDATVETRKLQLTPGMTDPQRTACGRKIGGL